MSLTKLMKAPLKLFKKDIITFVIIRRHDLSIIEDKLRYIAVRPSASISRLRQKVWHLLDLPDYCDEIIILKSNDETEIPLTEIRRGNDPQHPFILEVWLPGKQINLHNNMLMMCGEGAVTASNNSEEKIFHDTVGKVDKENYPPSIVSNETIALNNLRVFEKQRAPYSLYTDLKKSDLSSSTSLFKLHGRKSRDNFANILLKIQSDLSTLSNKLSSLENRIPT